MLTGEVTQGLDEPMPLWLMGDDAGDATEQWQGLLAGVRIYDSALTADEIAAIPEPSSLALLSLGLLVILGRRRAK